MEPSHGPPDNDLPALGQRERKKQKVRAQLTEAALSLFEERGFEATTVDDIAARADVVPRTFFRYFRSKDDALFGWYDVVRERARSAFSARPHGESALRALQAVTHELLDAHNTRERIIQIVAQLSATSPDIHARQAAARYDMEADAARMLAGRLDPAERLAARVIAAIVYAGMYLAVDQWVSEGAAHHVQGYADAVFAEQLEMFKEIEARYVLR